MHNHRRSEDTDDLPGHRLQSAIESVSAKGFGRIYAPTVMTAMLAVVSFVSVRAINWMDTTSHDIEIVKSDVRDLNTRFNESALRRIDDNSKTNQRQDDDISKLKEGVIELRGMVRTP